MSRNIKVSDKSFRPYLSHDDILKAIDSIADNLNKDYCNETIPPVLLCTLNGAIMFTAHLLERLNFDIELSSIKLTSYSGCESTGEVKVAMDCTADLKGRKVIVVEDIVDTGLTIRKLMNILEAKEAAQIRVCSLLFKPGSFHRQLVKDGILAPDSSLEDIEGLKPFYTGISIPDDFIVGFGLDYNELGRNYADIYVLDK